MDVLEQLRARAVELRVRADRLTGPGSVLRSREWRSIADLIDGMLADHEATITDMQRAESAMLGPQERIGASIWYQTAQVGYAVSVRALERLARHVSAVLGTSSSVRSPQQAASAQETQTD